MCCFDIRNKWITGSRHRYIKNNNKNKKIVNRLKMVWCVAVTAVKEDRGRRDCERRRKWIGRRDETTSTRTQWRWQSCYSWRQGEETQNTKVPETVSQMCLRFATRTTCRYCLYCRHRSSVTESSFVVFDEKYAYMNLQLLTTMFRPNCRL